MLSSFGYSRWVLAALRILNTWVILLLPFIPLGAVIVVILTIFAAIMQYGHFITAYRYIIK